tara:strand:- start:144 stop:380 length:237 start_codon:yes stop_codon:yes gene_type:complete
MEINNKSLKEIAYDAIVEAIYIWRQDNTSEVYFDKKEIIKGALELLYIDNLINKLIEDDMTEIVSELVWENEEDYFDV